MERERLLLILVTLAFVLAVLSLAWLMGKPGARRDAVLDERQAFVRVLAPLFAGLAAFSFLLGWALQASDPADLKPSFWLLGLAILAALWPLRTLIRAWRRAQKSLHLNRALPVVTTGLLRPGIVVSAAFRAQASAEQLAAALAHERRELTARSLS